MFEQSLIEDKNKTKKVSSILVSFGIQILLMIVLIVIPLIYFEAIPMAQLSSSLVAPPPPPPPPPPPQAPAPVKVVKVAPRQFNNNQLTAPKQIPKEVAMIKEDDLPPVATGAVTGGVPGGVPGGVGGGVLGGVIGSIPNAAPPPPPPPAAKPKPPSEPIRVGGNVQAAKLVRQPKPAYPQLAKQARIQGTVKFNAIIAKSGAIQNLQLVSGHPLLVPAATEAVKQWVYQPTLLNGEPVEVITQIDVNFTLSQ